MLHLEGAEMDRKRKWAWFGLGFAVAAAVGILGPLVVAASGAINMAAAPGPGTVETALAEMTLGRSLSMRAPDQANPFSDDPKAIKTGLDHYRENCTICHGAPGVDPGELAEGLNPPAPKLYSDESQEMSDGKLFWIVKNGIRMTGMPAFGKSHTDEQIWKIVAFLRHLPDATGAEKASLSRAVAEPNGEAGEAGESRESREDNAEAATAAQTTTATGPAPR
jgi:mono/diheme cytochrome c family protein